MQTGVGKWKKENARSHLFLGGNHDFEAAATAAVEARIELLILSVSISGLTIYVSF